MSVISKVPLYISLIAFLISLSSASISAGAIIGKVTSIQGRDMELDIGANKGVTVGDTGRVYYTVKIEGKDRPIYTAKFEVTQISQKSCVAQIQVRTGDVKAGLFVEILRGDLVVTSAPSGASVQINGKPMGVTPYEGKNFPLGSYKIRTEKEGYEAWEKQITVESGKTNQVVAELVALKTGELEVNSEPSGAKIYLDGKGAGETPSVLSRVNVGRHRVQVMKDGYVPHEETLEIRARERAKIEVSLKRATGGVLVVVEPPGANIHIDGRRAGVSPYEEKGLTPGKHKVRVEKEGYEAQEKEVIVKANERAEVSANLRKIAGGLVIQTEPPGANVYVDGKSLGVSPHEEKGLTPGKHKVRVEKEGYEAWEKEVTVEGGKKAEIRSQLVKVAVAKTRELPSDSQAKVMPTKTEKLPALEQSTPIWSVNDSWGYRNEEGKTWEMKVVRIEGDLYIVKNTADKDLWGIDKRTLEPKLYILAKGKKSMDREMGDFQFEFPLELNKEWNHTIKVPTIAARSAMPTLATFSNEYRVVANENITVRAGTFRAFKIELTQNFRSTLASMERIKKAYIWYSPEIKREVKVLYEGSYWGDKAKTFELTSYKLSQD